MAISPPWFLQQRSSKAFIITTITLALFTDLFLYGLIIPIIPFILSTRLHLPPQETQKYISILLTSYALSSLIFSVPAGLVTDRMTSRRIPFFVGLLLLIASTVLLAIGQTIAILITARILQGMSAAIVWTVGLVLLQDTVGREKLGVTLGGIFGVISVGNLISPVVGGIIYDNFGDLAVFGLGLGLLVIDLVLRAVMIEKSTAEKWYALCDSEEDRNTVERCSERSALLSEPPASATRLDIENNAQEIEEHDITNSKYVLPNTLPIFLPTPLLYIFLTSPRLMISTLTALVQSTLVSLNDTTIPLHALELFNFTSLRSGLLFIPLLTPLLVLGPVMGHLIDRYGTKIPSTIGFIYLAIPVSLLGLPHSSSTHLTIEIFKYATILLFCGIGSSAVSTVSLVEGSDVAAKYHEANPGIFGDNGPSALIFAWNSVVLNAGLAVGPMVAVWLIEAVGYGGMNVCMAITLGVVGVLCFFYMGETRLEKPELK